MNEEIQPQFPRLNVDMNDQQVTFTFQIAPGIGNFVAIDNAAFLQITRQFALKQKEIQSRQANELAVIRRLNASKNHE